MSAARKLASRLLRAVARLSSAESQDWANAMLRELDFIENDWAALFWALGSTTAIFRHSGRGFRKWFGKGSTYEEERMNNLGKKTVGVVTGIALSVMLVVCAFGLLYLTSRLFPGLGLDRIEWTHWLTVIVIPEMIFIVAAVKLWRKRAPVALGVLAVCGRCGGPRCGSCHDPLSLRRYMVLNRSVTIPASSVAPWLSVRNSAKALDFYKSAFGATEVFRLDGPEGSVVARLSVGGAEFWLSDESPEHGNFSPESLGGSTVRLILTVADPDAVFAAGGEGWCDGGLSGKRGPRLAGGARGGSFRTSLGDWPSPWPNRRRRKPGCQNHRQGAAKFLSLA